MADCGKTDVFLREKNRMCRLKGCVGCELHSGSNGANIGCGAFIELHPQEAIEIVQKWSDANPIKTRQSEFLKLFPNGRIIDGVLEICPNGVDVDVVCTIWETKCNDCIREYWLAEVE